MNKYLEKVARFENAFSKVKSFATDERTKGVALGGSIGAGLGSLQGLKTHHEDWLGRPTKPYTKKERKHMAVAGVVAGGIIGGVYGYRVGNNFRRYKQQSRSYSQQAGGGRYGSYKNASRGIDDIYKDLDATGQFRTKHEAKTHYRRMASKHHPDKFTRPAEKTKAEAKMKTLNKAWDEFNKHPEGLEKLANSYLTKAAAVDWSKVKNFVKANPGATLGAAIFGAEGLSSTTRKKNEHRARFHLRQIKNTTVGVAAGAGTGKLVQEGLGALLRK